MAIDKSEVTPVKGGLSAGVIALGLEYARELGITRLADDERRPKGYYTSNHFTGKSDVPADARERRPS